MLCNVFDRLLLHRTTRSGKGFAFKKRGTLPKMLGAMFTRAAMEI